jgi:hypothetical protein
MPPFKHARYAEPRERERKGGRGRGRGRGEGEKEGWRVALGGSNATARLHAHTTNVLV